MITRNKALFFVFTLVLLLTVSIGAISASDVGNDTDLSVSGSDNINLCDASYDTTSYDNKVVSDNKKSVTKSVSKDVISDKKIDTTKNSNINTKQEVVKKDIKTSNSLKREDKASFTDLNTQITSSDNITLNNDYVRGSGEDAITINKTIIINGNGHTFDANQMDGTFIIGSNADVTISNAKFTNYKAVGSSTTKASVYVDGGKLTLINVTFENNNGSFGSVLHAYDGVTKIYNATFRGLNYGSQGAIQHSYGTLIVDGSVFNGTTSNNGAIQIRYGSAIANVTNTTFVNNMANNYGGAINNKGDLFVDNCIFDSNRAGTNGGAIALRGSKTITIQNSVFKSNKVEGTASSKRGGAICASNGFLILKNNTMTNNYAVNGSNIFVWYSNTVYTTYIKFDKVTAVEDEVFNVIARVTDDMGNSISNLDVNFTINGKNYTAPLIEGVANVSISDALEPGNYTITGSYAGAVIENITVTEGNLEVVAADVFKYKMLQEKIDTDTTGIITLEKDVKRGSIEDKVVVNKTITIDGNGLFVNANKGRIFDITNGATLTLKNMIIFKTISGEGAIANITGSSHLVLNNVTIINNTGVSTNNKQSSLIYVDPTSTLNINNSIIENNTGAIIGLQGTGVINNTKVYNITAMGENDQGFINNEATKTNSLTIVNSIFDKNTGRLGGIYGARQNGQLIIKNTTFTNNLLTRGSGTVYAGGTTDISNSSFINNAANGYSSSGTAIYNKGALVVNNSVFINNTLPTGKKGSIIYNDYGGDCSITYSILIPAGEGSALYNNYETIPTANYNWWGTNTNPKKYLDHGSDYDYDLEEETEYSDFKVDYWVVLDTKLTPSSDIPYGSTVTITSTLNTYTDNNGVIKNLDSKLPDGVVVDYTSNKGVFDKTQTTIVDGTTTNEYTVTSPSAQINITQATQTNTFNINAIMPTPQKYVITESNFYDYFNNDGTIKLDKVVYGSQLEFSGTLTNKHMIINLPLNLTSHTTQAVFTNAHITILADGEDTNITNLIINNDNYEENVILLNTTRNINIKNNTITAKSTDKIHTIELIDTNKTNIENNTITTNGPSNVIKYDEFYMGYPDTSSIKLYNSNNNIIVNNNIKTKATSTDGKTFNTITGVEVYGNVMNFDEDITSNNNQIINNNITTEGMSEVYGVFVSSKVNNNTISYNNITGSADRYTAGIQLVGPATLNTISYNKVNATAKNITYGIIVTTNDMGKVEENNITNNDVLTKSSTSYAIELYGANKNNVKYNNLINNQDAPDYAMGIGLYQSKENNITDNNINLVGYEVEKPVLGDQITPENVGIKLMQNSNTNIIKNNDITSISTNVNNYAINITKSSSNTVTLNTLTATTRLGDLAVTTDSQNTIENNKPEVIITNDNYGDYFDEDGNIKNLNSGMTIYLSGEFKNKNFIIDRKLNILSYTTQAVLYNSTFVFVDGASDSSLENIIINNNDYDTYVISINGANNITLKNNTITQENTEGATHGIQLENSKYNTIHNNTINIKGLSYVIQYVNYVGHSNTTAIQGYNSCHNTITENKINVVATGLGDASSITDTIIGIEFIGNSMDYSNIIEAKNNTIARNTITLDGQSYAYAIKVADKADNTNITYNDIKSHAKGSAYGVDFEGPAQSSYITNNRINTTAQDFTYGILIQSIMGKVNILTIDSNIINCTSSTGYAIELYNVGKPKIINNNLTVTGNFSMGIGARKITDGSILNNNITTTGNSSGRNASSVDEITPENVGIKLTFKSEDNTIQNNHIITSDVAEGINVYTIIANDSTSNIITHNTLYSTNLVGSKSVNASNNTVRENLPATPSNITIALTTPISVEVGDTENITVRFYDEDGNLVTYGKVTFKYGDKEETIDVVNGMATLAYVGVAPGIQVLDIKYIGNSDYNEKTEQVSIKVYSPSTYTGIVYVSTNGDDSNDGSVDSPKLTIKKAVAQALKEGGSHQIIVLDGRYYVNDVIINSYLNITGQGNVIFDGRGLGRIFNITNGDVIIKNIIFTNGKSTTGGAIYNIANLTLINDTFIDNTANTGGAITTSSITIINSTFKNNQATSGNGGAINALYNSTRVVNITGSVFENNIASSNGGVYYESTGNMINITDSVFRNNTGVSGGALYLSTNSTIKNTTFTDNNSTYSSYSSYGGGAIYVTSKKLIVIDSVFTNNYAKNYGAAILANSPLELLNTTISNNIDKSDGIIYARNNLTIINSTIANNTANGGVIYISGYSAVFNMTNTNIYNNSGKGGVAIYVSSLKNFTIDNSTFTNNIANNSQRIVYISSSSTIGVINNSLFKNNIGNYTVYGNNKINITNTVFESNSVNGKLLYNINAANNTYTNNSLPVTLTQTITTNKTKVNITVKLSTDKVYNTTVNRGTITITDNGREITKIDVNDSDINYIYTTIAGEHNIEVTYTDASNDFSTKSMNKTITIDKISTTITLNPINPIKVLENITINATLTDDEGNGISNENIILKINGKTITTLQTDENGNVLYNYTIKNMGLHNINLIYQGSDVYMATNTSTVVYADSLKTSIILEKITTKYNDTTTITVGVVDELGNNVTTGRVILKINGKTLKDADGNIIYADVVNGSAKFTTTLNMKPKIYTVTAIYGGRNYYESSINNTTLLITKRDATVSFEDIPQAMAGKEVIIKVKVVDDDVDTLVNTGRVILKINGKTLKDTTGNIIFTDVVNGIATVKYTIPSNFKAKSYTLTAVFSDNYYNRVDVTSKFDVITQTKSLSTLRIDTSIITDAKPIQSNNSKTTIQNNYILPKAVKV